MRSDIAEKIALESREKHGDTLYHYTTIEALNGMLFGKKELWLGDASLMNDKKELTDFVDNLKIAMNDIINPEHIEELRVFFEKVNQTVKQSYPYIMSFSKRKDDAAQWERYADNARGICIEFNTGNMAKVVYATEQPAILQQVFYDYDARQHEHCEYIKNWIDNGSILGFNCENGLIENIVACASAYKHYSFSAEDEVRAIILSTIKTKSNMVDIDCVVRNGIVKKYAKIKLEKVCGALGIAIEDLFDGIIIAPRSQQNPKILQEYLEKNGCKNLAGKVKESDCPLR